MSWKSWTLGGTALAALTSVTLIGTIPSLAQNQQDQSQNAPAAQSNQNSPQGDQSTPDQSGTSGGQAGSSDQGMSGANATGTAGKGESLSDIQNAKTTLSSAQVQDSSGQQVGQVASVHTSHDGKPTKVDITLSSSGGGQAKTISVNADQLKYDSSNNTLITNASLNDLQAMPAASSTSGM